MQEKIKELMTLMPHTIGSGVSLNKAKEKMLEHHCHHLPVLDGGKLVGVISDKDLDYVYNFDNHEDTIVEDIMNDDLVIVNPEDELKGVLETMLDQRINSVIVSAGQGETWGIFTTTDLIRLYIKKH